MPLFEGDVPHINDLFDKRTGTRGVLNRAILRPPQHWRLYFMREGQIGNLTDVVGEHYHRTIGTLNDTGIKPLVAGMSRGQRIEELVGLDNAQASLLGDIDLNNPLELSRYSKGIAAIVSVLATYEGVHRSKLYLGPLVSLSDDKIRERMILLSGYTPSEIGMYIAHLKIVLRGWDLKLAA